jgi:hypothetical protein
MKTFLTSLNASRASGPSAGDDGVDLRLAQRGDAGDFLPGGRVSDDGDPVLAVLHGLIIAEVGPGSATRWASLPCAAAGAGTVPDVTPLEPEIPHHLPPADGSDASSANGTPPVQFTLTKVFDTLVETVGHRECIVWKDRRLTYAELAERSRRLASFLHDKGLGVRAERQDLAGHESGQGSVALALYGGEKIFVEEVERAISGHPAVADVVVTGRPSERWGQEVVAVVQLAEGADVVAGAEAGESITAHASNFIARYKLPKAVIFVELLQRSPSGKADYRWTAQQAEKG